MFLWLVEMYDASKAVDPQPWLPKRARRPEEPVADLTPHRVAHRGLLADTRRMADLFAALASASGPPPPKTRVRAIHSYLTALCDLVHQHLDHEERVTWPLLAVGAEVSVNRAMVAERRAALEKVLRRVGERSAVFAGSPHNILGRLARDVSELTDLLGDHIQNEEFELFPLIRVHLAAEDYRTVEYATSFGSTPALARWELPWLERHATQDERVGVIRARGPFPKLTLWANRGMFARQESLCFGTVSPSDRARRAGRRAR